MQGADDDLHVAWLRISDAGQWFTALPMKIPDRRFNQRLRYRLFLDDIVLPR